MAAMGFKPSSHSHRLSTCTAALLLALTLIPHTSAQLIGCNLLAPVLYSSSTLPNYSMTNVNGYAVCFSITLKATSGDPSTSATPYASWMGALLPSGGASTSVLSCESNYTTWQSQLKAKVNWPSGTSVTGNVKCCATQNCNTLYVISGAAAAAQPALLLLLSSLAAALLLFLTLT